jgi:carboxypeptidase Taq
MATDAHTADAPAVYTEMLDHVQRLTYVGDAGGLLDWDQQVMMPEAGTPARAKQKSALSSLRHDLLTDDDLAGWLDDLDGASLSPEQSAVVREVRREHERAVRVPEDLVERISEASSNALPVWEAAREDADFSAFEETLSELVDLKREYAAAIDPDRDPYEVLFEEYEPYLGVDTAQRVLERLAEELPPLIEAVGESDVAPADPFPGTYAEADQRALAEALLDELGYDWSRGRLDTSTHPFTSGTQFDARITTRFTPGDPLDGIGSTVHEFGHATYVLGLSREEYGTPLGDSRDLSVHESQSRFWENHVGRSRPFWELVAPVVAEHLGVDADPGALYAAANEVYDDNPIRVEADELTYHMHVLVRFEVERDLIRGDLEAGEVPAVWNERMDEYLGLRPENDAEGCLQDIHWTHGAFGYFPTYTLGSVLAAQVDAAMRDDLALDERIRAGEFDPVDDWLREAVHRHGCRYTTPDLIREATGAALTADHFVEYATEKYGDLYGLSD